MVSQTLSAVLLPNDMSAKTWRETQSTRAVDKQPSVEKERDERKTGDQIEQRLTNKGEEDRSAIEANCRRTLGDICRARRVVLLAPSLAERPTPSSAAVGIEMSLWQFRSLLLAALSSSHMIDLGVSNPIEINSFFSLSLLFLRIHHPSTNATFFFLPLMYNTAANTTIPPTPSTQTTRMQ